MLIWIFLSVVTEAAPRWVVYTSVYRIVEPAQCIYTNLSFLAGVQPLRTETRHQERAQARQRGGVVAEGGAAPRKDMQRVQGDRLVAVRGQAQDRGAARQASQNTESVIKYCCVWYWPTEDSRLPNRKDRICILPVSQPFVFIIRMHDWSLPRTVGCRDALQVKAAHIAIAISYL